MEKEKTLKDLRQEVSEIETYLEKRLNILASEYSAEGFNVDISVNNYFSAYEHEIKHSIDVKLEVTL